MSQQRTAASSSDNKQQNNALISNGSTAPSLRSSEATTTDHDPMILQGRNAPIAGLNHHVPCVFHSRRDVRTRALLR